MEEKDATKESTSEKLTRERFRFSSLLKVFDFKDEDRFWRYGKRLLFFLTLLVETLILVSRIRTSFHDHNYLSILFVILAEVCLTTAEAVKCFCLNGFLRKIWVYALDALSMFAISYFSGTYFLCALYMVLFTEFYISSEKMMPSIICFLVGTVMYIATFWTVDYFKHGNLSLWDDLTRTFNDLLVLFVHFAVLNVAIRFYKQYKKLKKTLKELDESKADLLRAYEELSDFAVLEERQRIAKDIHDTAGHSITTVIMQTEAAKLILDENPKEAKNKLVSANLQAKHALEELRESVHLLSGSVDNPPLKEALERIVGESTDGTEIAIRSAVDDVKVSPEVYRFLCNTLKEGISNGIRHGGATAFWFELKDDGENVRFLLSDNGQGTNGQPLKKGFGLTGMTSLVENLGGVISFVSDEEGFEIHIALPKNGKKEKDGEKDDERKKD